MTEKGCNNPFADGVDLLSSFFKDKNNLRSPSLNSSVSIDQVESLAYLIRYVLEESRKGEEAGLFSLEDVLQKVATFPTECPECALHEKKHKISN